MKLNFVKLNPTQNMTILVTDPVPRAQQSAIAEQLMAPDCVGAEQVGFLESVTLPGARARLQMMGGEFCGNASMSAAALFARADGLADGAEKHYLLEVSGAEQGVRCTIAHTGEDWRGTVSMPLPLRIERVALDGFCVPAVFFPGIAHLLLQPGQLSAADAQARIGALCAQLRQEALGLIFTAADLSRIDPLVYVRSTASAVWERGCGSGTAAVGAWRAFEQQCEATLSLRQPGGSIRVHAVPGSGRISLLEISGSVKIACEGSAYVSAATH